MSLHHYTNDATSFYIRLSVLDTQPHRNTEELENVQSRETITGTDKESKVPGQGMTTQIRSIQTGKRHYRHLYDRE